MSEPSKTDPLLALLTELDEDAHRITAMAEAMGELSIAITSSKVHARIDRLKAKLSRARGDEEGNTRPLTVLKFPRMSPAQRKALENAVTIDPPRTFRKPRFK